MSNHTPGPWVCSEARGDNEYPDWMIEQVIDGKPSNDAIAEVIGISANVEGNAILMAAAPEMLAALETAAQLLSMIDNGEPIIHDAREQIGAALHKAKHGSEP